MSVLTIALAHYRRQVALARRASRDVGRLWAQVDRSAIGPSWAATIPAARSVLESAQAIAAAGAGVYLDDVLEAQGITSTAAGRVQVAALVGVASDGRDLGDLLYQPAITALTGLRKGETVSRSLAAGQLALDMIVRTQVADAARAADQVAMVARPRVNGYVRLLSPPSCSRCVVLAGRWFEWNTGFDRHPRCDCRHIPGSEDTADDLRTDPMTYFESLPEPEQDRVFTRAGAEAVRLGANISQVVNARRGARGLTPAGARITEAEAEAIRGGKRRGRLEMVDVYGRQLYVTTEGVTTRGVAGGRLGAKVTGAKKGGRYRSAKGIRLMPESVLQIAGGDRAEAIRLLRRFGYII